MVALLASGDIGALVRCERQGAPLASVPEGVISAHRIVRDVHQMLARGRDVQCLQIGVLERHIDLFIATEVRDDTDSPLRARGMPNEVPYPKAG